MKKIAYLPIITIFTFFSVFASVSPSISLSNLGNNDSVQVNINADPNSTVFLYFTSTTNSSQVNNIGTTDSNGNLSITISTSGYNIAQNSVVYVAIGSLSGPQSTHINWPVISNSNSPISFNQNNLNMSAGQTQTITITGGNNSYIVSNNSNPTLVQASISGNTLNLYAYSSNGSANINICSTGGTGCGVVYVTVSGGAVSQYVTFSQSNPTISIGQTITVTVSGPTPTFTINSNSNQSVLQANISGSQLTITGLSAGASNINVCAGNGTCTGLNVTVNNNYSTGQLYLNQTSLNLNPGQTSYVNVSGSGTYYVSNSSNPSVATVSVNGTSVSITGITAGSDTVSVCQNSNSQCVSLYITVNNNYSNPNPSVTGTYLQVAITLLIGQNLTLTSSNTNGSLTISSNPNPGVANATISGNTVTISGISYGTDNIIICQTGTSSCGNYNVTIQNPNTTVITPTIPTTPVITPALFRFYTQLFLGMRGDEVYQLQKKLVNLGLLYATPNGYFGPATRQAVMAYQRQNGITQTGILGPLTRDRLNR